ncbi:hypothetical protein QMP26_23715 [Enterocloster clostridioformis]
MKILLFSDDKRVLEKTEKISKGWFKLIWCRYDALQREKYPFANIVIIHFEKKKIIEGTFLPIIKIKSKLGETIPILAILDGTPQEIYSVLKAGAYDYITTIEDTWEYKEKIKELVLWEWYQRTYGDEEK